MNEQDGLFTAIFWKKSAERIVRSFAASLASISIVGSNLVSIDWKQQLIIAGGAAVSTLVLCVVGSRVGDDSSDPSFTKPKE